MSWTFLLLWACAGSSGAPPVRPAAPEPPAEAAPAATPVAPLPDPTADPLGAACRARVEGPESAGECTTDGDCGTTGCGGEVCVAASNVGEGLYTCEILPCFSQLDRCGCQAGACRWTVREAPVRPPLGPPKGPAQP